MYLPVDFFELACDRDRLQYYSRAAASDRRCGVDATEISAEEVRDRCPIAETDDVLARFWVEDDGRANPTDATMALAKGARIHGVGGALLPPHGGGRESRSVLARCGGFRPVRVFTAQGVRARENQTPEDFSFGEINPVPLSKDFCGPESFVPDRSPIVGESAEVRNCFVAARLNSIGILSGGGTGKLLARWIRDRRAPTTRT